MTDLPDGSILSAELPLRVAAIDLGSNAIRVMAVRFAHPDEPEILLSERLPIRLGGGTMLDPDRIREAIAALREVRLRLDELGIRAVRAVATSAVRESSNRADLIDGARAEAGIEIEAISGEEEGRLVWEALRPRVADSREGWLLADLGGGSLELALAEGGELRWVRSLQLGTVRLLSALDGARTPLPAPEARRRLHDRLDSVALPRLPDGLAGLIATGGSADLLAGLAGATANSSGMRFLPRPVLHDLTDLLAGLSWEERMSRFQLREDRADVVVPAGIVLTRLVEWAGVDGLWVAGEGLKEGVIRQLAGAILHGEGQQARRCRWIETRALTVGRRFHFDEQHARQVCRIALRLFDGLQPLHGLGEADRLLLMTAALLHDTGAIATAARRPRHSRVRNGRSRIEELAQEEWELVCAIARYHAGPAPRLAHRTFGALNSDDRRRVRLLVALLRVADALEGHHHQRASEITVSPVASGEGEDGGAVVVRILLPNAVEFREWPLDGRCRRFFERVFGRPIHVLAVRDPAATSTPPPP